MQITYGLHAENQLKERGISKRLIEEILSNPEQIINSIKGRKIAHKVISEGKVKFLYRVIYVIEKSKFEVISAYKTRKIVKYWVKK